MCHFLAAVPHVQVTVSAAVYMLWFFADVVCSLYNFHPQVLCSVLKGNAKRGHTCSGYTVFITTNPQSGR